MPKSENELTCKDLAPGAIVTEAGNAAQYRTGDWRQQRPLLDKDFCNKCGLCFLFCPEGCIQPDDEGYFVADLKYCKGCGICAEECPQKAISMVEEKEE
ncbi:MAG: 4Fe-4S binding protein [Chloroflexota bacterium]